MSAGGKVNVCCCFQRRGRILVISLIPQILTAKEQGSHGAPISLFKKRHLGGEVALFCFLTACLASKTIDCANS